MAAKKPTKPARSLEAALELKLDRDIDKTWVTGNKGTYADLMKMGRTTPLEELSAKKPSEPLGVQHIPPMPICSVSVS